MPQYFDAEETPDLRRRLWESCGEPSRLTREKFDSALDLIFAHFQSSSGDGWDRARAGLQELGVSAQVAEAMWNEVGARALDLARFSVKNGLFVTVTMIAALGVLTRVSELPDWARAKWILGFFGLGVLVGITHIVRGSWALVSLRAAQRKPVHPVKQPVEVVPVRRPHPVPAPAALAQSILAAAPIGIGLFAARRIVLWFGTAGRDGGTLALEVPLRWLSIAVAVFSLYGVLLLLLRRRSVRLDWRAAMLAYGAFLAWLCGAICLVAWNELKKQPSVSNFFVSIICGASGFGLVAGGAKLFKLARQHMVRGAENIMQGSGRPPILYLRSFAVDDLDAPVSQSLESRQGRLSWRLLNPSFWSERRQWSFEEVVCKGLSSVAPVVAIGQPGEVLPKLGAVRMYAGGESWKSLVQEVMARSLFVCFVIGKSDGLLWEFAQARERFDGRRVVLIIPNETEYRTRWRDFAARVMENDETITLPSEIPEQTLGLAFRPGWSPVFFAGRPSPSAYRQMAKWVAAEGRAAD